MLNTARRRETQTRGITEGVVSRLPRRPVAAHLAALQRLALNFLFVFRTYRLIKLFQTSASGNNRRGLLHCATRRFNNNSLKEIPFA